MLLKSFTKCKKKKKTGFNEIKNNLHQFTSEVMNISLNETGTSGLGALSQIFQELQ